MPAQNPAAPSENDVLRRMLNTPPQPKAKPRPQPPTQKGKK
jgi:hypothetical protein